MDDPKFLLSNNFPSLYILQDPLGGQATGDHGAGNTCAGARAGASEIQVVILWMLEIWTEITQLGQIMTQPVGRAFHQVIAFAPGGWSEVHFEFDVLFQIVYAQSPQAAEYLLARLVSDG